MLRHHRCIRSTYLLRRLYDNLDCCSALQTGLHARDAGVVEGPAVLNLLELMGLCIQLCAYLQSAAC